MVDNRRYSNSYQPYYKRGRGRGRYSTGSDYNKRPFQERPHDEPPVVIKSPEDETRERIASILFKLGEKGSAQLKASLEQTVPVLEREYQLNTSLFLETFVHCITHIPFKISLIGTLTGLLNVRNYDMVADILSAVTSSFNSALEAAKMKSSKLLLRFLGECLNSNVILPSELIKVLNTSLSVLAEPQVSCERADSFAFLTASVLPWVGLQLRDRAGNDLDFIFNTLEGYMLNRSSNLSHGGALDASQALKVYRDTEEPYAQVDYLDLLWAQTQQLRMSNWEVPLLPRPFDLVESVLSQGLQHELGQFIVPSTVTAFKFSYRTKFWVFDDSVLEGDNKKANLPATLHIDRFILDDIIADTIRTFSLNHLEATRILLSLSQYFNEEALTEKEYHLHDAIIENILAEVFFMPKPHEKYVYYVTLIMNLCKESLDKIPISLGRSLKLMFNRLDNDASSAAGMDPEAIRRFSELFSHHLSIFGFSWKWSEWEYVLHLPKTSGRYVFIYTTLNRLMRLSYFERVRTAIPESFEKDGEIFPMEAPTYTFKYETAASTGEQGFHSLVQELTDSLTSRAEVTVVQEKLEAIGSAISENPGVVGDVDMDLEDGVDFVKRATQDVLIQCVMYQGSKSFSHVLNVIERYLSLLQEWNPGMQERLATISAVVLFWQKNTQFLEIMIDKLLNYRVIDPKSVVQWILSSGSGVLPNKSFSSFFLWTVLKGTLSKVNLKVRQVKLKLDKAKDSLVENMVDTETSVDVNELESVYDAALREKKETFILFCQKMVETLTSGLQELDAKGEEATKTSWWRWTSGLFREIGRCFKNDFSQLKVTLDAVIFTAQVDFRILTLWRELKAVYELDTVDEL